MLYHGSSKQNMVELVTDYNVSNSGFNEGKKWIYAADAPAICSVFTFRWINDCGIRFESSNYTTKDETVYTFKVPNDMIRAMRHPCSIYEIRDTSKFVPVVSGLIGEFRSSISGIRLHNELQFESALKCMQHFGIEIMII